jgi:hypothetical protein
VVGQQIVFETGIGHQLIQQQGHFFIADIDVHFLECRYLPLTIYKMIDTLFFDAGNDLLEISRLEIQSHLRLRMDIRNDMEIEK